MSNTYEVFCDESYYGLWAVRPVGEKQWGYAYHVQTKEEADGLAKELDELATLRSALKTERDWVASLTKDNGILLQAADATKSGALAVSQAGRIEKLEQDKARYEFCKRHMIVGHHGLAPGVTDISMYRIAIDCTLLGADEIIDRAMLPGTAANVQHAILTQKRPNHDS